MIRDGALEGRITKITEKIQVGKNDLDKQSIVLQEVDAQYPGSVCIDFIGDKTMMLPKYQEGDLVNVKINLRCNEYKGKYYNSINAWSIEPLNGEEIYLGDVDEDLPF